MSDFDLFRERSNHFNPKTPVAALMAYESDFIPISIFINKSSSTKPLDEEPYDIDEIERLLSRENLGLQTNIMLIEIFEKLIFSEDQEIALFAAESINIIENRYNKQIQKLKDILEEETVEGEEQLKIVSELGTLFYELAILNRQRESIKKFFLKESYSYFSQIRNKRRLDKIELNTLIRILLELKLLFNASDVLEKECSDKEDSFFLIHSAEIEFAKRNYGEVKEICRLLMEQIDTLTEKEIDLVTYWMGA